MILLLAAAAFACPNADAELERATTALVGGDFVGARAALAETATAFGCAVATRDQLARYWLVEGAVAQLGGDAAAARAPLAAARAVAPTTFDDRLGPKVRAAWTAATPAGEGTLLLEPSRPAVLDGAEIATWPTPVAATPHLVQVVAADGAVRFGKIVAIAPGEDALVETGLGTEPDTLATTPPPTVPKHKKSPALLVLAGVAAAGAGACAGGALAQNTQMDEAKSEADLQGAYDRQKVFGYSSYGLVGVAAVSLGVHIALP